MIKDTINKKRKTVKELKEDLDKYRKRINNQIDKIQKKCNHQFEKQYSCAESWRTCKLCEFSE